MGKVLGALVRTPLHNFILFSLKDTESGIVSDTMAVLTPRPHNSLQTITSRRS